MSTTRHSTAATLGRVSCFILLANAVQATELFAQEGFGGAFAAATGTGSTGYGHWIPHWPR